MLRLQILLSRNVFNFQNYIWIFPKLTKRYKHFKNLYLFELIVDKTLQIASSLELIKDVITLSWLYSTIISLFYS